MRPPPKRGVLTDARFYCLLIATFVFIALVSTSLPLMAVGGALASLIICSLVRQRLRREPRTLSIAGALFAGAAILALGLALDLLIITLDGYVQPYHWTQLDNPFVPPSAPLNERIVTRTQCLIAGGSLLPASIASILLTRRTITAVTREMVTPADHATKTEN
jgi:hypothetical protein